MQRASDKPLILTEVLRFGCALAVMGCHYGVGFWRAPGVRPTQLLDGISYRAPGEGWLQFGWLGVEIFFVISGMVIAHSAAGSSAGDFLRRRVLRLAPAAWICSTITLLVLWWGLGDQDQILKAWGRSMLFWPTGQQIDSAYWTLGIELSFYLAVTILLLTKRSDVAIERLGIALGAVSGAFWVGCTIAGPSAAWLFTERSLQLLLLPYGCFFALGIVIARGHSAGWPALRLIAFIGLVSVASIEVAVHSIESANETGLPVAMTPALALFATAIVSLVFAPHIQPLLTRAVDPALARSVGLMTYPLYLVHQEAGAVMVKAGSLVGLPTGASLIIAGATALLGAWCVSRHAEPAARKWLSLCWAAKA